MIELQPGIVLFSKDNRHQARRYSTLTHTHNEAVSLNCFYVLRPRSNWVVWGTVSKENEPSRGRGEARTTSSAACQPGRHLAHHAVKQMALPAEKKEKKNRSKYLYFFHARLTEMYFKRVYSRTTMYYCLLLLQLPWRQRPRGSMVTEHAYIYTLYMDWVPWNSISFHNVFIR